MYDFAQERTQIIYFQGYIMKNTDGWQYSFFRLLFHCISIFSVIDLYIPKKVIV